MNNSAGMAQMPSAGHFADMQTLMQQLETMSGWMQQTREEGVRMQEMIARMEQQVEKLRLENAKLRASSDDTTEVPLSNGDSSNAQSHISTTEIHPQSQPQQGSNNAAPQSALLSLHSTVENLERQNHSLTTHNAHLLHMHNLYEENLTNTTESIRRYVYEQQNHIIALHQHYTGLLQQSRSETVEAQIVHQEWQEGLSRLSGGLRETLRERESGIRPWRVKVANLKEENRVLRNLAGWNPPSEDEDEFSGSDEEQEDVRGLRG